MPLRHGFQPRVVEIPHSVEFLSLLSPSASLRPNCLVERLCFAGVIKTHVPLGIQNLAHQIERQLYDLATAFVERVKQETLHGSVDFDVGVHELPLLTDHGLLLRDIPPLGRGGHPSLT